MDSARAELLREVLAADPLIARTDEFAAHLQRSSRVVGGFLLVGTPQQDPWHLTAHLADEARFSQAPELEPTLVRWNPPADAPPHLAVGLDRLTSAQRGETVLVVAATTAEDDLLERADDARTRGATILALASDGDRIEGVAHETLLVPTRTLWTPRSMRDALRDGFVDDTVDEELLPATADDIANTFDTTQHLMSLAVGSAARTQHSRVSVRQRLGRMIDGMTGAPSRW